MRGRLPAWARDMVADDLAVHPVVEIEWRTTRWERTSGWASTADPEGWPVIKIAAGTNRRDCRYILVHEIAHVLVGTGLPQAHPLVFWQFLLLFAEEYGFPMSYVVWRSASYAGVLRAAELLGHPRLAARGRVIRERPDWENDEGTSLYRVHMAGLITKPLKILNRAPHEAVQEAPGATPLSSSTTAMVKSDNDRDMDWRAML